MTSSFDHDVAGAILEWGVLHRVPDTEARTNWVAANVKGSGGLDPWRAAALEKTHLHELLRPGRDAEHVRRQLDRAFLKLEIEYLIEPYRKDSNPATLLREVTALGAELVREGSHIEYLGGLPTVVRRWRQSVAMIYDRGGGGIGTGFLVAPNMIATAAHVVEDLPSIQVWFEGIGDVEHVDGDVRTPKQRTRGEGPELDIALIRLKSSVPRPPIRLATDFDVLDPVVVLGYPPVPHAHELEAPLLASTGEVSSQVKLRSGFEVLIVSCPIRGGHSGGPALNRRGQAIGVVSGNLFQQQVGSDAAAQVEPGLATLVSSLWVNDLLAGKV